MRRARRLGRCAMNLRVLLLIVSMLAMLSAMLGYMVMTAPTVVQVQSER